MIGLTSDELDRRNKDSLIRYIGALQSELAMVYETGLLSSSSAINTGLDSNSPSTLKSKDYENEIATRSAQPNGDQ